MCDTRASRSLGSRRDSLCTVRLLLDSERIPHPCICTFDSFPLLYLLIYHFHDVGGSKIHAASYNNRRSATRRTRADL